MEQQGSLRGYDVRSTYGAYLSTAVDELIGTSAQCCLGQVLVAVKRFGLAKLLSRGSSGFGRDTKRLTL